MARSEHDIFKDIFAGNLPEEFLEERNIVDPENPEAHKVSSYLTGIAERLLVAEGIDPAERKYRFLISAAENPNAYIISRNIDEPLVIFTKGLIQLAEYEDQLAGVSRHEFEHHNLNDYGNSKVQEWLCDQASVGSLLKAGYNPYGLPTMLAKFPYDWEKGLLRYTSDHPDLPNRVRDLESHVAIITRKKGDIAAGTERASADTPEWTPIDPEIKRAASSLRGRQGYIPRLLERYGYEALPVHEKINLLTKIHEEEICGLEEFYNARIRDFSAAIGQLEIDTADPQQKAALDEFVDGLLIPVREQSEEFYSLLSGAKGRGRGYHAGRESEILYPLGRLADLDGTIEKFINAGTAEEAEITARTINELGARYNFSSLYPSFPHIKFPAIEAVVKRYTDSKWRKDRAWAPHVEWVKQANTNEIRHALERIGVGADASLPRLSQREELFIEPIQKSPYELIDSIRVIGIPALPNFEERLLWNKGLTYRSEYLEAETQRMAIKDEAEKILIAHIDWGELETDFFYFTDRYSRYLVPECTVAVKGGNLFAAEFLRRVEDLSARDPSYRKKLAAYFLKSPGYSQAPGDLPDKINAQGGDNARKPFVMGLPNGVQASHPFVRYILDDVRGLFPTAFKAHVISCTPYLKTGQSGVSLAEKLTFYPALLFGAFAEESLEDIARFRSEHRHSDGYTNTVIATMLDNFLRRNAEAVLSPPEMHALLSLTHGLEWQLSNETKKMVAEQIESNANYELGAIASAQKIAENYTLYASIPSFAYDDALRARYEDTIRKKARTIRDPRARRKLATTLLFSNDFGHPEDVFLYQKDRYQKDRPIIFSYGGQIANHDFRGWVNQLLADSIRDNLGLDDDGDAYHEKILREVGFIKALTSENYTLTEVLPLLADAVNAQPRTAFAMRDIRNQSILAGSGISTFVGAPVEMSLVEIAKDPNLRLATIDFLTSPVTDEAALNYGVLVNEKIKKHFEFSLVSSLMPNSSAVIVQRFTRIHQEFSRAPFEARTWYLDKILFPPEESEEYKFREAVHLVMNKCFPGTGPAERDFGANFDNRGLAIGIRHLRWEQRLHRSLHEDTVMGREMGDLRREIEDLGLEPGTAEHEEARLRMAALDKSHRRRRLRNGFRDTMATISERIPIRMPRIPGTTNKSTRVMRQIAEAYLAVVPPNEQRLILSALIGARSQAYEDQKKGKATSPGKFAAQVLSYMDEMGGKILQALDSHPDIPADIKRDMGNAKSDYKKPHRWDALEWCMQYGIQADDPGEAIAYYGPVVASGSMGFTMFNTTEDARVFADTILRPDARPRTEREARNIVMAAEKLAEKDPRFLVACDIAAVAQRDARIETNMALAFKQGQVAAQVYNGMRTVAVLNGKAYPLVHETAAISKYSSGAKRAVFIEGKEFKELPETTSDERDYKKATAIQLYGIEIFNILSGKPTDRDRHEANQKVDGRHAGHFDFGMTALTLPTDEQKSEMVKVVTGAFRDHFIFGRNLPAAFDRFIQKSAGSKDAKDYLSGFRRQILAMGNIEKHISAKERKQILAAVLRSGKIDPVIQRQIESSRLGKVILQRLKGMRATIFQIDDSACAQHIRMPELTEQEMRLVRGEADPRLSVEQRRAANEVGAPRISRNRDNSPTDHPGLVGKRFAEAFLGYPAGQAPGLAPA